MMGQVRVGCSEPKPLVVAMLDDLGWRCGPSEQLSPLSQSAAMGVSHCQSARATPCSSNRSLSASVGSGVG